MGSDTGYVIALCDYFFCSSRWGASVIHLK